MIDAGTYRPAETIHITEADLADLTYPELTAIERWAEADRTLVIDRMRDVGFLWGEVIRIKFPARIPSITSLSPAPRPQWRMPAEEYQAHANCYSTVRPIYAGIVNPNAPGRILDVTL